MGEFEKKNAMIFGVSFDRPEDNLAFAEKYTFNFPLLCDTTRAMGLAYGAATDPSDPAARRVAVIIGPDGFVKHYFPKVVAREFPNQALGLL